MIKKVVGILAAAVMLLSSCGGADAPKADDAKTSQKENAGEVNVYTHRYYDADKELFKKFTEETGIKVNVKKDKADKLIALLESEGEHSAADLLITVDAGRLYYAKELGLLQKMNSPMINNAVAQNYRDKDDMWTALTKRARVVAYSKERVKAEELSDYASLTDKKWKGKIAVRSSSNLYNQSLMASLVALKGDAYAQQWAEGIVANMSRAPKGNDRDQIKEVALGNADLAIVNTYYLGKLLNSSNEAERKAGEAVAIHFPASDEMGTHINVSGAGITKHAPNRTNAQKLLEFLTSEKAQELFASTNYEYPVNARVKTSDLLKSWGAFSPQKVDFEALGANNAKAVELFKKANWK
jgi:iron(III) transport system substrate-binding protein